MRTPETMEKIVKIPTLPDYAMRVISRPDKPAYEFMKKHDAQIYVPKKNLSLYFIRYRGEFFRINYNGMPSQLVQDRDFLEWFKTL